ncbi:MAG: DUF5680 domain-containing protein [archaeon]|jgi:hypothetical protein|nr:DUF5680 domain-containing protein [archaeon]MDD2477562.1 DUF5680 domain-containing protein [Candidatus ainarchaeum sp.]MDD3084342.1 DUF5680 domain-containing protein [Candidatus ainarchaeum sp.]MDD4221084.1 DUF5680 domain-containing protein [Candidatus ainarchaeum sp.]MDD4662555.1 DUF5680 domain-containing protein [Candidatus ainarchaeum sp.]
MISFIDFLVIAKKNTYASSRLTDFLNKDGSKELVYEQDNYKYVDRYYGYNPFIGQEIVFENNNCIWGLNYFGEVLQSEIFEKEVYSFLKSALLKIENRSPLRGPNYYKENNLEYFSQSLGDVNRFSGKEYVDYKGKTIYRGLFSGGIIRKKLI